MSLKTNKIEQEDVASSIVSMISFNISQISYLSCKLHDVKKVYFVGNFVHGHNFTMDILTRSFEYWAKQEVKCMYMTHDGYLGAIGALINTQTKSIEE